MLLAVTIIFALGAHGQNTPATSTPQTKAAAPAATKPGAIKAQAAGAAATANSASYGSRRATKSRARGSRAQPPSGSPASGAPAAPDATASILVTGQNDGSSISKDMQSSVLPGVPLPHNAYGITRGTPIHVRLQQAIDSGHARNGQMVRGVLTAPVGSAPAGAPVQLTVVSVAAAGQMTSNGELSLQVVSVNGEEVLSDVITAEGKVGAQLLPDGAPARGTEAVFTPDQPLTLPAA
jgi:hypothetical protein